MDNDIRLRDARLGYDRESLDEEHVATDPFVQGAVWFDEALKHPELIEPNAMTLATVDSQGRPSARIVLLRGFSDQGCVFFTNYFSRKGLDLDATGVGALLFYWDRLERELRIEGTVERLSVQESDTYFMRRPRGHRISAWASAQSEPVPDRHHLETAMQVIVERFRDQDVPRPPHWGGYRLKPLRFEFWQGRANRLHDRIQYTYTDEQWRHCRLAP